MSWKPNKEDGSAESSRRKVLKVSSGVLALGGAGVGSAKAGNKNDNSSNRPERGNENANNGKHGNPIGDSIELKRSNSQPKSDWEDHVEKRKERKEALVEDNKLDDEFSSLVSPSDPTKEHVEYLDHWKHEREHEFTTIWGSSSYADSEHLCTVYEAFDEDGNPLTDSEGYYYYMIELYSQAEGHDTAYGYNRGRIEELYADVEVHEDNHESTERIFESRDPSSTASVNGEFVTVKDSVTVGSVTYGAEDEVWVEQGEVGPDTWTPGDEGEYAIRWEHGGSDGEDGRVDIMAFVSMKSSRELSSMDDGIGLSWSWSLDANHS